MASEASSSEEVPSAMAVGPPTDVEQVRAFLLRVVPVMLEEDVLPDMSAIETVIKAADPRLKKFAEDPQERTLLVLRTLPPETEEEEGDSGTTETTTFTPTYEVRLGLNYQQSRSIGVAFIKRGAILEADKSVRLQLRVINFSEDSPFEILHSYVRDAVTPYFNSYIQATKKATYVFTLCMTTDLAHLQTFIH